MGNFIALLLSGFALLLLVIALVMFVHGLRARLEARRCSEVAAPRKRH